jgi:hypothetical protein
MSLKRHPALQPFSRDHLIGLFHAQRLIKLENNANELKLAEVIQAFASAWEREIKVHFADEDRLFASLPVAQDSLGRLDKEHVELRALILQVIDGPFSPTVAARAGRLLDAHIRWEEHELFPEIETTLTPEQLEDLAKETTIIENSRHRSL